jgi:endo-1,4-beta-xylanase
LPKWKSCVTWWGLSDANIWLEGGGLLDRDHRPKPVYERLRRLIREQWKTPELTAQTDAAGVARFRGFFGEYDVDVARPGGSVERLRIHLRPDAANVWEFTI